MWNDSPFIALQVPLKSRDAACIIARTHMLLPDSDDQHTVARLFDFFGSGTPWQRRLWDYSFPNRLIWLPRRG